MIFGPNGITEIEISAIVTARNGAARYKALVHVRRNQVFFGDQLDHVGQRLQQAVRSHAIRAGTHLDVRDHLALHPLQVREHGHQHGENHQRFDHGDVDEIEFGQVHLAVRPILHDGMQNLRITPKRSGCE